MYRTIIDYNIRKKYINCKMILLFSETPFCVLQMNVFNRKFGVFFMVTGLYRRDQSTCITFYNFHTQQRLLSINNNKLLHVFETSDVI